MSLLDDLSTFLDEEDRKELGIPEEDSEYKIIDDSTANYYLRKLEEIKNQENEINTLCDDELNRLTEKINLFRNSRLKTLSNTENYLTKKLEEYAEEKLKDSNKKSLKLPFGTLQFKKTPNKYEYDDTILLNYLTENKLNDYLNIKTSPNKTQIKKAGKIENNKLYIDNQEIPGITIEEGQVGFSVKLT